MDLWKLISQTNMIASSETKTIASSETKTSTQQKRRDFLHGKLQSREKITGLSPTNQFTMQITSYKLQTQPNRIHAL